MADIQNRGYVAGKLARRFAKEKGTTVIIEVADNYERNGELIERSYNIPVVFFGKAQDLVHGFEDGEVVFVTYKITTFKPKDAQYSVVSLNGIDIRPANLGEDYPDLEEPKSDIPF